MKKLVFYLGVFMTVSCAGRTEKEIIPFRAPKTIQAFEELVIRVEAYPLQTEKAPVIGADPQLMVLDDGSYVVKSRGENSILHFSSTGQYLNAIGSQGNETGECLDICSIQEDICNIQARNNRVITFTKADEILYYEPSGKLVQEDREVPLGTQSFWVPEGILSYYGFGSGRDWRVSLLGDNGYENHYLPTKAKVIHLTAGSPVFFEHDSSVFFTDTYSPTIYKYENGEVSPYLTFDFGKYAIRDEFFENEDAYESMNKLLSGEFAMIQRYMENENYQLVEFFIQSPSGLKDFYGIKSNGGWMWVSAGDKNDSPFFHSIQWMDENAVYCLVEPSRLKNEKGILSSIAGRNSLKETDNPLVIKLFLK